MRKAKEIMTKSIRHVEPTTHLPEIAKIMRDEDIGIVPVEDHDRIVGMITDRDIVVRSLTNGHDTREVTAEQVMSPGCLYCFEDDTVAEVAKNMAKNQVKRLPVLNKDKRLVGIISLGDITCRGCEHEAEVALHGISEHKH